MKNFALMVHTGQISISFFMTLICSAVFANEPTITIPYNTLLAKQEIMDVKGVQAKIVTDQNGVETIRLLITAMNACGEKTFVEYDRKSDGNPSVNFFQIGNLGPHIQPGCRQVIEYYWQPRNYDLKDGQSKEMLLYIGPIQPKDNSLVGPEAEAITVKVKATTRIGDFPNGIGSGYYATYTNLEVDTSNVAKDPFASFLESQD